MTKIILFLAMTLWPSINWSAASPRRSITFVGYSIPPFYMRDEEHGVHGACFEIMNKLCELESFKCKFTMLSLSEAMKAVLTGKMDAGAPFGKTPEREKLYYFSPPLFKTAFSFFGLPKNIPEAKSLEDLGGLTVGVTYPTAYAINLEQINATLPRKIKIIHEKDAMTSVKMANQNSYALAYTNRDAANYFIQQNHSQLQEIPSLVTDGYYYFIFAKSKFTSAEFEKLNARLRQMINSKTIEGIAKGYGLTAAAPQ